MHPRYRRFVLELVCDVPHGLIWPPAVRALAAGMTDADGGRDVDDVDLLAALTAMKLARFDILTRVRAGHIELTPP